MDYEGLRGASTEAINLLEGFWPRIMREIQNFQPADFKNPELPLARIKKIMKLDEEVKMISAEAPIIFAKAAEIFIQEVTIRAWLHTEENKRRTLQRNDVALAVSKYDQFDFLIDIVPREEIKPSSTSKSSSSSKDAGGGVSNTSAHQTSTGASMATPTNPTGGLIVTGGGGHHSPSGHQQAATVVQTSALLNQQLPLGATIIDAQTASLLLNGGATATTNGAGQVQYFFAMPANGAAGATNQTTLQGLPLQGLPAGAQIILNAPNAPIFSMAPSRTDC